MQCVEQLSMASGHVQYELTFSVPLLVGRLIDEPLVVQESFSSLPELFHLLDDAKLDAIRKAYAADDIQIIGLLFSLSGEHLAGELHVNASGMESRAKATMNDAWLDDSVKQTVGEWAIALEEVQTRIKSWGTL